MKCINVRQPWADLIASGWKQIDHRSWGTQYCGSWCWLLANVKRSSRSRKLFDVPWLLNASRRRSHSL
jgi:hypothetical protein